MWKPLSLSITVRCIIFSQFPFDTSVDSWEENDFGETFAFPKPKHIASNFKNSEICGSSLWKVCSCINDTSKHQPLSAPFTDATAQGWCVFVAAGSASFPLDRMYGDNFCSMGLLSSTTKNAHLPQMKPYLNLSRVWKLCSVNLCDQIRWWETRFSVCGYAKDIMDLLPPNSMCPANFPTKMFPGKNTRNMHMSESIGTHLNHITKHTSLDGSLYFPKQSWKIALNSIPPKTVSDYMDCPFRSANKKILASNPARASQWENFALLVDPWSIYE